MEKSNKSKVLAYALLWVVVFVWGLSPTINKLINKLTSPTVISTIVALISFVFLLFYCAKDLKQLNKKYFLVAVPTGIANAVGSLLQKIGLLYTSPAKYAFLENLSCIAVPILMFIFIRKKPSLLTIISAILCLIGAFVLSGLNLTNSFGFGVGEILCALAGIVYGFNIAGTGCFAKDLKPSLYVLIHMGVSFIISLITMFLLNAITINNTPISPIYFSAKTLPVIFALALISNVLCWILRTTSIKNINPSTVAVVMPFSSVIASVFSIIVGTDKFSYALLIGGIIIFVSILLSSISDVKESKLPLKQEK